ncbi:MAG: hypothetical protein V2J55_11835 [Candidatus Competibacteraceae bacterium]|jgi:multidrug efflux pump|nr:hypothetical protein [Candidatus Competibacteraceae bacterium]
MMLRTNIDLVGREIAFGAPATQWWVSLATAVIFGLCFATVLTLIVTLCGLMLGESVAAWHRHRPLAAT